MGKAFWVGKSEGQRMGGLLQDAYLGDGKQCLTSVYDSVQGRSDRR